MLVQVFVNYLGVLEYYFVLVSWSDLESSMSRPTFPHGRPPRRMWGRFGTRRPFPSGDTAKRARAAPDGHVAINKDPLDWTHYTEESYTSSWKPGTRVDRTHTPVPFLGTRASA